MAPSARVRTTSFACRHATPAGEMVPLGSLVDLREINAPSRVIRYNLFPAAELNANPAAGYSTGQTIKAMEELARETLPRQLRLRMDRNRAPRAHSGQQRALRVSYLRSLRLSGAWRRLYENWALPLAIILIVPMCVLCLLGRHCHLRRRQQHLHPDRLCRPDRSREQERHSHRGICQAD